MKGVKFSLFLKRNSPTILSIVGSIGAITAIISAVKATPKALLLIEDEKERINKKLEQGGWQTRVDKLNTVDRKSVV